MDTKIDAHKNVSDLTNDERKIFDDLRKESDARLTAKLTDCKNNPEKYKEMGSWGGEYYMTPDGSMIEVVDKNDYVVTGVIRKGPIPNSAFVGIMNTFFPRELTKV